MLRSAQMNRSSSLPRIAPTPIRPELITTRANLTESERSSIDHIFGRAGHDDQRAVLGQRGRSPEIHIRDSRRVRFRHSPVKSLPPTPDLTPPVSPRPRSNSVDAMSTYSELSFEFGEPVEESELVRPHSTRLTHQFYDPKKPSPISFLLTPSPVQSSQRDSRIDVIISPSPVRGTSFISTSVSPRPPPASDESYFLQAPENSVDGHSPSAVTARSTLTADSTIDLQLNAFPSPPGSPPKTPRSSWERTPTSATMQRTISI